MNSKYLRRIPFYPLFALLYLCFKNGINIQRIPLLIGFLLKGVVFEPFRWLEILLYERRIVNHQLEKAPIFILGHWRSGTSHLQDLMSKPVDYTTTSLYKSAFADTYMLTENWLKIPINRIVSFFKMRYSIQRMPFDFDLAAEMDMGVTLMCSLQGYTWGFVFAKRFEAMAYPLITVGDESNYKNWLEDYDYLIKKLSYFSKGKRIIIKSPGDTARVDALLEKYPNAKFVFIHRDAVDVFHSTRYLWNTVQSQFSLQKIPQQAIDQKIIETYKLVMTKYLDSRNNIPKAQLIEVEFKNLRTQPIETLTAIFQYLDLGELPKADILPFLRENKSYKTNRYTTSPELKALLEKE